MGFLDKFRVPYRANALVLEGCGAVLGAGWRALEGFEGLKGLWRCLGGGVRLFKRGSGEGAEGELVERWLRSSGDALPDEGRGGSIASESGEKAGGRREELMHSAAAATTTLTGELVPGMVNGR